jgi:Flp pilus assembly protein TadG
MPPTAVIVIFLLFFAVLAFAWFYVQRAKTRDAATTAASTTTPVAPADTAPDTSRTVDPAP